MRKQHLNVRNPPSSGGSFSASWLPGSGRCQKLPEAPVLGAFLTSFPASLGSYHLSKGRQFSTHRGFIVSSRRFHFTISSPFCGTLTGNSVPILGLTKQRQKVSDLAPVLITDSSAPPLLMSLFSQNDSKS